MFCTSRSGNPAFLNLIFSISSTMSQPRVPVELAEKVIDASRDSDSHRTTLLACSLVCRSWTPRSRYHLSVGVSYPNERDRAFAEQLGRDPGGDIMIHGRGPEGNQLVRQKRDWTAGCITVSDEEIEDVYAMLQLGAPIMIHA